MCGPRGQKGESEVTMDNISEIAGMQRGKKKSSCHVHGNDRFCPCKRPLRTTQMECEAQMESQQAGNTEGEAFVCPGVK